VPFVAPADMLAQVCIVQNSVRNINAFLQTPTLSEPAQPQQLRTERDDAPVSYDQAQYIWSHIGDFDGRAHQGKRRNSYVWRR